MIKELKNGLKECSIILESTNECEVKFDLLYTAFRVENHSSEDMWISIYPDKSSDDDGVTIIPAGEIRTHNLLFGVKNIYLNGSGEVRLSASNVNFNCSSKGGAAAASGKIC